MSVRLVNYLGGEYVFPITFRVEGLPSESAVPALTVENRDGALVAEEDVTLQPRTLAVSGSLFADTAADLRAAFDALAQFIHGPRALKLYVDETRYVNAHKVSLAHRWVASTGRTLAEITIAFRANDPFLYGPEVVVNQVVAKGGAFTVNNPGTASVQPTVVIKAAPNATTGPKLTNQTAERILEYAGTVQGVDTFVCWCNELRVEKNGLGALAGMNADFLYGGFPLLPGDNLLLFEDAAVGEHSVTVELHFSPRYL